MSDDTTTITDPAATARLLTYLQQQVLELGDSYTAQLLGSLASDRKQRNPPPRRRLQILATLLPRGQGSSTRGSQSGHRVMAIESLASQLDLMFGRGCLIHLDQAVDALRDAGIEVPRRRVQDAIVRRGRRDLDQLRRIIEGEES